MEAIILAGGFGTRLKAVLPEIPKPMAPVGGRPFLSYLLDELAQAKFRKVVLAVGYKAASISDYFGGSYDGVELVYSVEETPLGTGGAIRQALNFCSAERVFVLNGDTFFAINFAAMRDFSVENGCALAVAVKKVPDVGRYGSLKIDGARIISFAEKKFVGGGVINGGIYCVRKNLQTAMPAGKFSFEADFLASYCDAGDVFAWESDGYFIDIGVPEDYERAQLEIPQEVRQ